MKRVNWVFIGECVIIILLLIVLGFLLRDNKKMLAGEERGIERSVEVQQSAMEASASEMMASGVVKVSDLMRNSSDSESSNIVYSDSVSENSVSSISENMIKQGKTLFGKKIVVFGDSIWNAARGKDGISEYVQEGTGATVYNCAIGGTTAAVVGEDPSFDNWTSNSFNGMIYVARKLIPAEQILAEGEVVRDIIEQVDFNETDYVIVAYGLNDFFSDVPIFPKT